MFELPLWNQDRAEEGSDPIRAAIYARTSSQGQRFGYSLEEQIRLCLERCEILGWIPVYVFQDEEESAKDTDRPKFQLMMETGQRGLFDVVVFWKLDRVSRSLLDAVQLENQLQSNNVALYSLTEQIDTTTSAGRFNFRNLASAAEFERDMIRERSRMGLAARALQGKWPNNSPPFGYDLQDGRLVVNIAESIRVRKIFNEYIEKKSMPNVANELNNSGERTKQGNKWCTRAVGDVLRNRIYIGEYSMSEISMELPECQIVRKSLFSEATDTRMRFRNGMAARTKMPQSRKSIHVNRILNQYRSYAESSSSLYNNLTYV